MNLIYGYRSQRYCLDFFHKQKHALQHTDHIVLSLHVQPKVLSTMTFFLFFRIFCSTLVKVCAMQLNKRSDKRKKGNFVHPIMEILLQVLTV